MSSAAGVLGSERPNAGFQLARGIYNPRCLQLGVCGGSQSWGDDQGPTTVLLGRTRRTCCTVPLQTKAADVLWEMLVPAQSLGLGCLLLSHQTKAAEVSSTLVYHPLV